MNDNHLTLIRDAVASRQQQELERMELEREIAASMEESRHIIHEALSAIVIPLTEVCIAEIKNCGTYAQYSISYDHEHTDFINSITLTIGGERIGVYPEMWTHASSVAGVIRVDIFKAHGVLDQTIKVEASNLTEDSFSGLLAAFAVGALQG